MKKIFILSMAIGTLFISGCSCTRKENDENKGNNDNPTVITDEAVIGEQSVNGILFENTTFQVQNGFTTIVTKVTNRSGAPFMLENYQMTITDKDGKVLTILTSTVNENLEVDAEKLYTTPFNLDLSAATKVEYNINVVIPE